MLSVHHRFPFLILLQVLCIKAVPPETSTKSATTDPFKNLHNGVANLISEKLPLRDAIAFGEASKENRNLASEGMLARIKPLLDQTDKDCVFGTWAKNNTYSVYLGIYHFVKNNGREFVERKLDTNCSRLDNQTPWVLALRNQNAHFIKSVLEFRVKRIDGKGLQDQLKNHHANELIKQMQKANTELMEAIEGGDKKQFLAALDNPYLLTVNFDLFDSDGEPWQRTPMKFAIDLNKTNFVAELFKRGALIEYDWPLYYSIYRGNFECFDFFLKHGASIEKPMSAIHKVVEAPSNPNLIKMAQLLIKRGADINAVDIEYMTPIFYLNDEKIDLANFILGLNPNINHQAAIWGRTALHKAVENGQLKIVQLLLKHEADVNIKDNFGLTPIFYFDKNVEIAKLILRYNPEINHQDFFGSTVLHSAFSSGQLKIVELLLKNQANVTIADTRGRTPLLMLCNYGREVAAKRKLDNNQRVMVPIAKILLEYGANPKDGGKDGMKSCLRQLLSKDPTNSDFKETLELFSRKLAKHPGRFFHNSRKQSVDNSDKPSSQDSGSIQGKKKNCRKYLGVLKCFGG